MILPIGLLVDGVPVEKIKERDSRAWWQILRVTDTVPASSAKQATLNIDTAGHFVCFYVTGKYTTLAAGPADSGICRLSMTMIGGQNRVYIPQPVDMDLLLSPGRVKDPQVAGASLGTQLFYPLLFPALFRSGTDLQFNVTNGSDFANSYGLAFHGWRVAEDAQISMVQR